MPDGEARTKCRSLLRQYAEPMIAQLARRLDSDDFCCNAGFCTAPPPDVPPLPTPGPKTVPAEGPFGQMWESGRMQGMATEGRKIAIAAAAASNKRDAWKEPAAAAAAAAAATST